MAQLCHRGCQFLHPDRRIQSLQKSYRLAILAHPRSSADWGRFLMAYPKSSSDGYAVHFATRQIDMTPDVHRRPCDARVWMAVSSAE